MRIIIVPGIAPGRAGLVALCVAVIGIGGAGRAHAQVSAAKAAEETFTKGRELMKDKKYALACEAFEQSQRLDPQYGTQYNLAGCYVELGKLASAWNLYRELSRSDNNASRKQASTDLATQLAGRVPKLALRFETRPDGVKLTMNNQDAIALIGVETPVDSGTYVFTASAPGYQPWRQTVDVTVDSKIVSVVVRILREGESAKPDPIVAHPDPVTVQPPPERTDVVLSNKKRYGQIATFGGAGLALGGVIFGAVAYAKWNTAQDLIDMPDGTASPDQRVANANAKVDSARLFGNLSTACIAVGLVAVAGGLYLWGTAPDDPMLQASVSSDSAGFAIAGRF